MPIINNPAFPIGQQPKYFSHWLVEYNLQIFNFLEMEEFIDKGKFQRVKPFSRLDHLKFVQIKQFFHSMAGPSTLGRDMTPINHFVQQNSPHAYNFANL